MANDKEPTGMGVLLISFDFGDRTYGEDDVLLRPVGVQILVEDGFELYPWHRVNRIMRLD